VVLVYRQGTAIERTISAVLHPSEQAANTLRDMSDQRAADMVSQIRAIVGESA
jgi:hypothetical protein